MACNVDRRRPGRSRLLDQLAAARRAAASGAFECRHRRSPAQFAIRLCRRHGREAASAEARREVGRSPIEGRPRHGDSVIAAAAARARSLTLSQRRPMRLATRLSSRARGRDPLRASAVSRQLDGGVGGARDVVRGCALENARARRRNQMPARSSLTSCRLTARLAIAKPRSAAIARRGARRCSAHAARSRAARSRTAQ